MFEFKVSNRVAKKPLVKDFMHFVGEFTSFIKGQYQLPSYIEVRFNEKKYQRGSCQVNRDTGSIYINVSQYANNVTEMMETFFHELTHAEQFYTGRLKYQLTHDKRFTGRMLWNSQPMKLQSAGSYQKYLSLPWEVEARKKASDTIEDFVFLVEGVTQWP